MLKHFESRAVLNFFLFFLVIALLWLGLTLKEGSPSSQIRGASSGWQAVFLENGQTYFGKFSAHDAEYYKLENVYYLREGETVQKGEEPSKSLNLVKLGGEFHGPQDTLYIRRDSVLFWENLKEASRVVSLIKNMK